MVYVTTRQTSFDAQLGPHPAERFLIWLQVIAVFATTGNGLAETLIFATVSAVDITQRTACHRLFPLLASEALL